MDRHLVLTLGRSGSNTLVNVLNQNPEVLNLGELLGEWNDIRRWQRRIMPRLSDDAYLDRLVFRNRNVRALNFMRNLKKTAAGKRREVKSFRGLRSVGFKDFSLNFERYGLRNYVRERPGLKVVGLVRENVLDRLISAMMLEQTGIVAVAAEDTAATRRIRIEPERILPALEVIDAENRTLREMLDELPPERVHVVSYEDLFSEPARTAEVVKAVFHFLGVRQIEPEIRMRKIIRGSGAETIENLGECRAAVRGTRFETLFDPAG